jgi:hypothetical protein
VASAQERAENKAQKQVEAQRKRDERAATAFARKTAAAQEKAAAQAAREAKKQTEKKSRVGCRRLQSRSKDKSVAQKATSTIREPVVIEPVEQATTAKGRPVRRPARFRT